MRHNIIRLSAAAALLATAGLAVVPHVTGRLSSSAVVNAPIISVRAPFDGTVEMASPGVAKPVYPGGILLSASSDSRQNTELRTLKGTLFAIEGEAEGLAGQLAGLRDLRETLLQRRRQAVEARQAWFAPRIEEAQADLEAAIAGRDLADQALSRLERLQEKGNATSKDLAEAVSERTQARSLENKARATLERLAIERDSMDVEAGIDLGSNALEQSGYRLDEISMRTTEIEARLEELAGRRRGIESQIAAARGERSRQALFHPVATATGVIWEASPPTGSSLVAGEEVVQILDCDNRFMEVILGESLFEDILPGTPATVKLKGAKTSFEAEVIAVYGSGSRPNRKMRAAEPRITVDGGLRVIVGIGSADPSDEKVARAFCDVGRTAQVHFERKIEPIRQVGELIAAVAEEFSSRTEAAPALDAQ